MSFVDKHARSFGKSLFAPLNGVMSFSGGGEFDAIALQNSYNEALPVVYFGTASPETAGIVQNGLNFFLGAYDSHILSTTPSGGFTTGDDETNPALLAYGDTTVSVETLIFDKFAESAEKAESEAANVFKVGSKLVGVVGFACDAAVVTINALKAGEEGNGANPNFTKTEQSFISSAPGLIFGAAALLLAPEGFFGLAIGLAFGAGGNLLGAAVNASINSFLQAAPDVSVGAYFASLLAPLGVLRDGLVKGESFVQQTLQAIQNTPTAAGFVAGIQAAANSDQQLLSVYRQQTFAQFNSLQYTDSVLTQIANEYAIVNPAVSAAAEAAAVLVYKYAASLVNSYVTNSGIINTLIAAEKSAETTLVADVNLLGHDATNVAALNGGYAALGTLTTAVGTAVQQLQEETATVNPNDLTAGNYGELTANTSSNGTIQGATTGADLLIGTTAAEVFDGLGSTGSNPGTDIEIGGGGADTFIFNQGYGSLDIDEDDQSGTSSAVLKLGSGITASMITASGIEDGGVILQIANGGGTIILENELAGAQYGVTAVEFSNGTSLTRAQLAQLATSPTTGADTLYGASNSETLNGLGGGDLINSTGDGDTYVFDRGYGSLEINADDSAAAPTSRLSFGAGIATTDVAVTADASGDLILTVESSGAANGDVVQVDGELDGNAYGVQSVVFSNGTTWSHTQLLQFAAVPTTGADNLYLSAPTTIDGLGGGDVIHGSGGADVFVYESGYGSLEVSEQSTSGATTASLKIEAGLSLGTVTVTGDSSGDILLHFSATDVVQVDHELFGTAYGVAQATDSNGVTLTAAQLIADELNGAAGSLTVYGTSGADTFTNLGKSDVAVGNGGGDTFDYSAGSGALDIQEFDTNAADSNVLVLSGISSTQATFSLVAQTFGTGILVTDGTSGDAVTIDGMGADSTQGVSAIEFLGNSVTLTREQIVALATGTMTVTGTGTSSAPLTGGSGSNIFNVTGAGAHITSSGLYDKITDAYGTATINLTAPASGLGHDASIALGKGGNSVTAVSGNVTVTGLAGSDSISLSSGNGSVSGIGSNNKVSVLSGNNTIILGNAKTASSDNTITVLSGGKVTDYGNGNQITLGASLVTDPTQDGSTTVTVGGSGNNIVAYATNNETLSDSATSSANTFTLNSPLASNVVAYGSGDMVFVSGGSASVNDKGTGNDFFVAQNSNLVLTNFTADSTSLLSLLPSEGYSTLSGLLAALVSDGHGGSFLALGGTSGTGSGVDFAGVSVASLTSFANSGTHFAFPTTFPNGWH